MLLFDKMLHKPEYLGLKLQGNSSLRKNVLVCQSEIPTFHNFFQPITTQLYTALIEMFWRILTTFKHFLDFPLWKDRNFFFFIQHLTKRLP